MDIWEANMEATSIAPHTCNQTGLYKCSGAECGFNGVCDQWGCSYNPYRNGAKDYYGPGLKVDTSRPFTVVTQFPASENGTMYAIRRLYVQDGKVIQNAALTENGTVVFDEINDAYCSRPGGGKFMPLGGVPGMGEALSRGMVLIFSVWWDVGGYMNWLDNADSGPCNATEGNPEVVTQVQPDPAVVFSQVKWGEIGSTYTAQ
jgi:cellulase